MAKRSRSFPLRLHFRWLMIGLNVPVLAKCKTEKSEHHQDGSGYHQPMRILHRGGLTSSGSFSEMFGLGFVRSVLVVTRVTLHGRQSSLAVFLRRPCACLRD